MKLQKAENFSQKKCVLLTEEKDYELALCTLSQKRQRSYEF